MDGNLVCLSTFLENMDHELPEHNQIVVPRQGYKVDGEGIKKRCNFNKFKSVDYYENHDKHGLLYVEFSDLLKQDCQIQASAQKVKESNLDRKEKGKIRKAFFKEINKELVQKYKDSVMIRILMRDKVENIPSCFENTGTFIIVVAPFDTARGQDHLIEVAKFFDTLKDKVADSLPTELFSSVKIVPLDKFCV